MSSATAMHTVEATGLARFMREALWAYPATEALHIVGIGLLFGSIAIVDLRLIGLGRRVPVSALAGLAVPWSLTGFVLAATTGILMFTAHAAEFITLPVFILKMSLIVAGGINAAFLHSGVLRDTHAWDTGATTPPAAKVAGGVSIALWIGVVACGRLLAYF
jgi:hypothetical protein